MKDFNSHALFQDLKRALPAQLRESRMIERSFSLAFEAHKGQFREARDPSVQPLPYVIHPVGVAKLVAAFWQGDEIVDTLETMICVALLHDTMEDTPVQYDEIKTVTSQRCAELVLALTKPEVSKTRGRSSRNELFLQQIREAGNSSIYLKVCDSIHNLSRPGSMPVTLLKKTIEKARGPYTGLLAGTPFEERLGGALKNAVAAAEAVWNSHQLDEDFVFTGHLHEYLEQLIQRTKGKQLEIHDIVDILSRLPGIVKCAVGDLCESVKGCLLPLGLDFDEKMMVRITAELEKVGESRLSPLRNFMDQPGSTNGVRLLACHIPGASVQWAVVTVDPQKALPWLGHAALHAIINLLGERMAKWQPEVLGLTGRIGGAYFPDAGVFQSLNLDRHAITKLQHSLEFAEFMFLILQSSLEAFRKSLSVADQVDRTEGRVKSLSSIVRKLQAREITLHDLDDLVGFRVIFLSSGARDEFAGQIQQSFTNRAKTPFYVLPVADDSVVLEKVSSNLGYKATHLRFTLLPPDEAVAKVSCEIQLRTLLEDSWARVSESLMYKERSLSKKKGQELLEHLAKLRDEGDRHINESRQAGAQGQAGCL